MYKILFFLFICSSTVFAQDSILIPAGSEQNVQGDIQDLVWNRYTTENFTILSIENKQGKWLSYNIENIKSWCLNRWGLPDIKFDKECRVMVVPNKDMLKRLFNISESRYEARKSGDKLEIIALWLSLDSDEDLVNTVPYFVTICSLLQIDEKYKTKSNMFLVTGMAGLNTSLENIKDKIKNSSKNNKDIIALLDGKYDKASKIEGFDSKSLIVSLMLKKEFGENKFLKFLFSNKNTKDSLHQFYGFTPDSFLSSYLTYCKDLIKEVELNNVPSLYLEIEKR